MLREFAFHRRHRERRIALITHQDRASVHVTKYAHALGQRAQGFVHIIGVGANLSYLE